MRVLVVNPGSQSVKLRVIDSSDAVVASADLGPPDDRLVDHLGDFLGRLHDPVDVSGHRVVHGGSDFTAATVVDADVRARLDVLNDLAPLHNPVALAALDATRARLGDVPAVACFDTAFHSRMDPPAFTYAVPDDWATRWGLRRFGFHGLSCAWATRRAAELLGRPAGEGRLLICHLGAGASVTAVDGTRSVDTTMGFTPLEGLVMATRCGDLDPGALLWVLQHGETVATANAALERHSGLLGLSGGRTPDMRELLAARERQDQSAQLAISVYLHRLVAKIAAMAAATRGAEALIFTGGVGENSAVIRSEAAAALAWLGVAIDERRNAAVDSEDVDITASGAAVRTLVIHAREDLEIAGECRQLFDRAEGSPVL
jgi:acetate kinase